MPTRSKNFFVNSKILDHIIRLGEHPFRYNLFSYNSKGNMIIDTEAYPLKTERKFFGIKKDGKEFFSNDAANKNYHFSMTIPDSIGRIEGESCFIKIKSIYPNLNGKEFLMGISMAIQNEYKVEFYDLNENKKYDYTTYSLFDNITFFIL